MGIGGTRLGLWRSFSIAAVVLLGSSLLAYGFGFAGLDKYCLDQRPDFPGGSRGPSVDLIRGELECDYRVLPPASGDQYESVSYPVYSQPTLNILRASILVGLAASTVSLVGCFWRARTISDRSFPPD